MNMALFPELVVNGEHIAPADIAAEAQNQTAPAGKPGLAWRKAANAVAMRTLLLQEAARQGVAPDPQQLAPGRRETDEEAMIRALLEANVHTAPPTPEAVEAEWSRDPARFRAPPLWEVSHILFACDPRDDAARAAALERATGVADRLAANPAGFSDMARTHSDCGSRASGGALGQMGPGDTVPEFETVLKTLGTGAITPAPVLSRHGWHLIRIDAVAEGRVLPFAAVRADLAAAMEKAAWARAARQFTQGLVDAAEISGADMAV